MNGFKHSKPDAQFVRAFGPKDLDARRGAITKLYWEEDRDREEVMGIMESQHKFRASERQYKDAFKRWGLRKNATSSDMKHMIRIRKRRFEAEGKNTQFSLCKRRVPEDKIDRFVQRTGFEAKMMMSEAPITGETPPAIDYKTPSDCNSIVGTPQTAEDAFSTPVPSVLGLNEISSLSLDELLHSGTNRTHDSHTLDSASRYEDETRSIRPPTMITEASQTAKSGIPSTGTTPPKHRAHFRPEATDKLQRCDEVFGRIAMGDLFGTVIMDEKMGQPPCNPSIVKCLHRGAGDANEPTLMGTLLKTATNVYYPDRMTFLPSSEGFSHPEIHRRELRREIFEQSIASQILSRLSWPTNDETLGSCLRAAAGRGDRTTVQRILGSSPCIVNWCAYLGDRTALHDAAFAGHCDIIQYLLQAGADAYKTWHNRDAEGHGNFEELTALELAILAGQVAAVETLVLSVCATIDHRPLSKWSNAEINDAVKYAIKKERQTCLEILIRCVCQHQSDFAWNDIVHFAVNHFHFQSLRTMLKYEIAIDLPSPRQGYYPLTLAMLSDKPLSLEMVEFLAQNGVNVNRDDVYPLGVIHPGFSTLLHMRAAEARWDSSGIRRRGSDTMCFLGFSFINPPMTLILLQNGADPNSRNDTGATPLHLAAAMMNGASQVQILLDSNADPNIRDLGGSTPLHWAAAAQIPNHDVLYSLVQAGADLHLKNKAQRTPFEYLRLYHDIESLDHLRCPVGSFTK